MSFSIRNAVLSDDEEWFNIPTVVRSFLRQLNNEVQNNRASLDTLLSAHEEQDKVVKRILSKQGERDIEVTKTVLTLQHESRDVENSLRDVVDGIRDQMRRLSDEQKEVRKTIKDIKEETKENVAISASTRTQVIGLTKSVNNRMNMLESVSNAAAEKTAECLENIVKENNLKSQKHEDMLNENRTCIEQCNLALCELYEGITSEVDNLKLLVKKNEDTIKELALSKNDFAEKCLEANDHLNEKVKNMENVIQRVENSSDDRFESVFSTLEKSQALIDKLSRVCCEKSKDHSSVVNLIEETREMQSKLAAEIKATVGEKMNRYDSKIEQIHRHIDALHYPTDFDLERMTSRVSVISSDVNAVQCRIDEIEGQLLRRKNEDYIKGLFNEFFSDEKNIFKQNQKEMQSSLMQQQKIFHEEIEYIKSSISRLEVKCEQAMLSFRNAESKSDSALATLRHMDDVNKAVNVVREQIGDLRHSVEKLSKKGSPEIKHRNVQSTSGVSKGDLEEWKIFAEHTKHALKSQADDIGQIHEKLSHSDLVIKDIPKCYQRYMDSIEQKLAPALLELEVFKKKVVNIEHERNSTPPGERVINIGLPEERLDEVKVKLQQNQLLQSIQRHVQTLDVRVDGVESLTESMERKMEGLSKDVLGLSSAVLSVEENERQRGVFLQNEIKKTTTRMRNLDDEMNNLVGGTRVGEASQIRIEEVKSLSDSLVSVDAQLKGVEKKLSLCLTVDSPEWLKLQQIMIMIPEKMIETKIDKLSLEAEQRRVTSLCNRVLEMENSLLCITREMKELQSIEENARKKSASRSESLSSDMLLSLVERVTHLEDLQKDNLSSLTDQLILRVSSIEEVLTQMSGELSLLTPLPNEVGSLGSRISEFEGLLNKHVHTESPNVSYPALLDRLATVEGIIGTFSRSSETCSTELIDLKKRMHQLEERDPRIASSETVTSVAPAETTLTSDKVEDKLDEIETKIIGALERVTRVESEVLQIQKEHKPPKETFYTMAQMDARFENLWASFLSLLTRKEDQEGVEQKLSELRQWVADDIAVRINSMTREMQRSIDERVKITEVRELLQSR